MRKFLLTLTLFSLLVLPLVGFAQPQPEEVPNLTGQQTLNTLSKIVNWLFTILIIVAVISIIVAAFYFVTAAGNEEQVRKARNFVIYAMIGVLVALLSRGLVALVKMMVR